MTPSVEPAKRKFLILTTGRSGSSLLAGILIDAGASFGVRRKKDWDRSSDAHANKNGKRAAQFFRLAYDLDADKPSNPLTKWLWDYRRHVAKKSLKSALSEIDYLKTEDLDLTTQSAFKLGYFPTIIASYRRFEQHALSRMLMRGHFQTDKLAADYNRVYRNTLALLQIYGGCAISYEELTTLDEKAWAKALAAVTGLSEMALLDARASRVDADRPEINLPVVNPVGSEIYSRLYELRGKAFSPSPQALRSWQRKNG